MFQLDVTSTSLSHGFAVDKEGIAVLEKLTQIFFLASSNNDEALYLSRLQLENETINDSTETVPLTLSYGISPI